MDDEVELEPEPELELEPASELELAPEAAAAPVAWYRRRAVARLGVGLVVVLVAGVLSIALVDEPAAERVDLDEALVDEDDDADPGRPSTGVTAPPADVGGGEDRVEERERSERETRRSARRGTRTRGSRSGGGNRGDRPRNPGSGPGTPTTAPPTTAPPTTTGPGAVVLTPVGATGPLAPMRVAGERPCPAGTASVAVVVTGVGGDLDGEVLLERSVTPAADGSWSVPELVVPAVASVADVAWAATATSVSVAARCAGGPSYSPVTTELPAVDPTPTQMIDWDGTRAVATVTGCPTAVRLELFVGATAPTLDAEIEPVASVELELDDGDPVPTWHGWLEPAPPPAGQHRWVSAACVDEAEGRPVWRHPLQLLD